MSPQRNHHIVLIGPIPPPHGGMAGQVSLLYDLLLKEGLSVDFIPTNSVLRPRFLNSVKVIRAIIRLLIFIKHICIIGSKNSVFHVFSNSGWSWFLYSIPVLVLSKFKKFKVIINYRGGGLREFIEKNPKFFLSSIKMSDKIIVPSQYLEKEFFSHKIPCQIINNFINISSDDQVNLNKYREKSRYLKPRILLVTRNLEEIYGIDIIINAFKTIHAHDKNTTLVIAGSGPELPKLKALVKKLNLDAAIQFVGRLSKEQIFSWVSEAYCLLNASRVDNMPNSLIEAMALGTVVISTNAGGIPYLIEDNKTGILIDINDVDSLADKTCELLSSPERCFKIAQLAQISAKAYSWDAVKLKWFEAYEVKESA